MFDAELYPPQWRAIRREKLQQVNYCCEECGVKHLAIRENTTTGAPYIVYLSIAHKRQYETWKRDADTMVLCQRCHRGYDRQFRRKAGRRYLTPIGYARVYVEHGSKLSLAGLARTFDDLRDIVAALPDAAPLEIQLITNAAIVGNGHYRKTPDGVSVLCEFGACQGLPL